MAEVENMSPAQPVHSFRAKFHRPTGNSHRFFGDANASGVWEPSCVVSGHEREWGRCMRPPTSGAAEMPWCRDSGKGDVARLCQNLRWQLSPQVREWGDGQTANKNL